MPQYDGPARQQVWLKKRVETQKQRETIALLEGKLACRQHPESPPLPDRTTGIKDTTHPRVG